MANYPAPVNFQSGFASIGQGVAGLTQTIADAPVKAREYDVKTQQYDQLLSAMGNLKELKTNLKTEIAQVMGATKQEDGAPTYTDQMIKRTMLAIDGGKSDELVQKASEFINALGYRKEKGLSSLPMWGDRDYKLNSKDEVARLAIQEMQQGLKKQGEEGKDPTREQATQTIAGGERFGDVPLPQAKFASGGYEPEMTEKEKADAKYKKEYLSLQNRFQQHRQTSDFNVASNDFRASLSLVSRQEQKVKSVEEKYRKDIAQMEKSINELEKQKSASKTMNAMWLPKNDATLESLQEQVEQTITARDTGVAELKSQLKETQELTKMMKMRLIQTEKGKKLFEEVRAKAEDREKKARILGTTLISSDAPAYKLQEFPAAPTRSEQVISTISQPQGGQQQGQQPPQQQPQQQLSIRGLEMYNKLKQRGNMTNEQILKFLRTRGF